MTGWKDGSHNSQPPPFVPGPPPASPPTTGVPLPTRYPHPPQGQPPYLQPSGPEGPFQPPYPEGAGPGPGMPNVRPWWGMGDALMIIPIFIVINILAAIAVVVDAIATGELADLGQEAAVPIWALTSFTLVQQLSFGAWPLVVSKWKGEGPAKDWGLWFKLEDLGIGLGVAMIGMFAAGLAAAGAAFAMGLDDSTESENLQVLTDAEGTVWLWVLVFTVVVVAPIAEELLFRGLILQSVRKRWGSVVAVVVTILAFAPLHMADGGYLSKGQVVLVAAIATLAIVFAVTALKTGRLAASIVAHMIINGIGVAGALGYFGGLTYQLPT